MNKEIEQDDAIKTDIINEDKKEFHKGAPKAMDDEIDIDNPIAAMTALKHPEIMEKAK